MTGVRLALVAALSGVVLGSGARLLELPATHSLGMLVRAVLEPLDVPIVHAYFHDTDLLRPIREAGFILALSILGRIRATPTDLDALRSEHADAPEIPFGDVYAR